MSKRWPGKIIIGLTGNIATGKSVVRRMLEALEAFGIDADGLAHRAMSPGAPAFQPIVDQFGKWVLQPDGQIDRAKLAKVVFTDPDALAHLEAITHPIVKQVVELLIKRSKKEIIVVEAIKLLEAGLAADADAVWVVDAPPDVQVKRLTEQRKMTEAEAQMRIAAQPPQSDKLARANTIIYNGGGYENTFEQVQKHLTELLEKARPKAAEAAAPAPAAPTPTPAVAAPQPTAAPTVAPVLTGDVVVRRGGPKDAEAIAGFLNKATGQSLTRTDVMMRFGEKAYMMAEAGGQLRGLGGVMVENLICRIDELYLAEGASIDTTLPKLLDHIEKTANELQSEVSLLFLPLNAPESMKDIVRKREYDLMQASELRIPDWREAAEESAPPNTTLNVKRLREDRVLKPI